MLSFDTYFPEVFTLGLNSVCLGHYNKYSPQNVLDESTLIESPIQQIFIDPSQCTRCSAGEVQPCSLRPYLVGATEVFIDVAELGLLFVSHNQSLLPFSSRIPQAGHVATLHTVFLGLNMAMWPSSVQWDMGKSEMCNFWVMSLKGSYLYTFPPPSSQGPEHICGSVSQILPS